MVVAEARTIKSGSEYNHLFPKPQGEHKVIRRDANLAHTLDLISQVVHTTLPDTTHIAPKLKAATVRETCRNIWHFGQPHPLPKRRCRH